MNEWWRNLEQGERKILSLGLVFVLGLALYLGAFEPSIQQRDKLLKQIDAREALLSQLRDLSAQARQLRTKSEARAAPQFQGQSLLAVANASARRHGVLESITRTVPESDHRLRLQLEKASFDSILKWLQELDKQHGIYIRTLTISALETPGTVRAELQLTTDSVPTER